MYMTNITVHVYDKYAEHGNITFLHIPTGSTYYMPYFSSYAAYYFTCFVSYSAYIYVMYAEYGPFTIQHIFLPILAYFTKLNNNTTFFS